VFCVWVWVFSEASGSWLGDEDCDWFSASVVRCLVSCVLCGLVGGRRVASSLIFFWRGKWVLAWFGGLFSGLGVFLGLFCVGFATE